MTANTKDPACRANPDYGRGAFWRRIELVNHPGRTEAALEDNSHAMRCRLTHADGQIISVRSDMIRVPMNLCSGADGKLKELAGERLDVPYRTYFGGGRPAANCSHLFDLAWLAISHARRDSPRRLFDITVPDAVENKSIVTVEVDGDAIHRWQLDGEYVVDSGSLAGTSLKSGFIRRALDVFSGDELEAALVLYKGYIVSRGRRKVIDAETPPPVADLARRNACFAFGEERVAKAFRIWSRRSMNGPEDFTIFDRPWEVDDARE